MSQSQIVHATEYLITIAELHGLKGVLLIPASYQDVKFVSQNTDILVTIFSIMTSAWVRLTWLCKKPNLYRRTDESQIAHLLTYHMTRCDDVYTKNFLFPIVIKRLTPGDGDTQLSYAALWHQGTPEAMQVARKKLSSVYYSGFVEVEVKRDLSDRTLNILDVIPRLCSWLELSRVTGTNLTQIMWNVLNNKQVRPVSSAQPKMAWMYLSRDIVAAAILMKRGKLRIREYLASLPKVRAWAAFSWSDLNPASHCFR